MDTPALEDPAAFLYMYGHHYPHVDEHNPKTNYYNNKKRNHHHHPPQPQQSATRMSTIHPTTSSSYYVSPNPSVLRQRNVTAVTTTTTTERVPHVFSPEDDHVDALERERVNKQENVWKYKAMKDGDDVEDGQLTTLKTPEEEATEERKRLDDGEKEKERRIQEILHVNYADYYQFDPYSLVTEDGLSARARDFTSQRRMLQLTRAHVLRCRNPTCFCVFDESKYYYLSSFQLNIRKEIESKPMTYFLHNNRYVPCRLCKQCLKCEKPYIDCSCDYTEKHKEAKRLWDEAKQHGLPIPEEARKWEACIADKSRVTTRKTCRNFIRLLYWICTFFGILQYVYDFFMTKIGFAVGGLAFTLFTNLNDKLQLFFDSTTDSFQNGVKMWAESFGILILIVFFVAVIKWLEYFYNIFCLNVVHASKVRRVHQLETNMQRLRRIRFTEIEKEKAVVDSYKESYDWLYYSDDNFEGKSDPDIARANLSQPADAKCCRRFTRKYLLNN
jgi:hypothetical protein